MNTSLECINCIFNQVYRASLAANVTDEQLKLIMSMAGDEIQRFNFNRTPPEVAFPLYKIVEEISHVEDAYRNEKAEHITKALSLLPGLENKINKSDDKLLESVKASIIGNAIDLGSTYNNIEVTEDLFDVKSEKFCLDDYDFFKDRILNSSNVVFISDNAGETVFDKPLVDLLVSMGKVVKYAVKSKPIINDATKEDAILSKIACQIIETGSQISGTILFSCSKLFREAIQNADLIIAKGQANYETLSQEQLPIFFLFMVKCLPIEKDTGSSMGSMLLLKSKNYRVT